MEKIVKIVTYLLAAIGLASIVKHIHTMRSKEGCCLCGWHKKKEEEEKPTGATASHKTKEEEEKPTGSRYGSNPVKY